mmetsp:Transcript_12687/g.24396  ORF Transcript_12687/g.24396 Transcript_12687/m.24396 type:complete len:206 (-) Transcript_12687:34-651(-)|eukprot:scaffold353_cov185-Amphora_coffeaeformis.AAC.15
MSIIGRALKFRRLSVCLFLAATRSTTAFSSPATTRAATTIVTRSSSVWVHPKSAVLRNPRLIVHQRAMSSDSSPSETAVPSIRHINKEEMKQILMEHEEMVSADLESPYFIMDVRTEPEVQQTGKLGPSVPTLPVQLMMPPYNAWQMDDEDFEEAFGFAKPSKDLTMVFSCAAGIRSVSACKMAQQAGYKKCINYMGGANEWFYT